MLLPAQRDRPSPRILAGMSDLQRGADNNPTPSQAEAHTLSQATMHQPIGQLALEESLVAYGDAASRLEALGHTESHTYVQLQVQRELRDACLRKHQEVDETQEALIARLEE